MSFWKADTRVSYAQKSIAVPAENGKQFFENGKIVINVQPDVGFFQPSESYLQFRVKVGTGMTAAMGKTKLQLDADLGGQVLIRNIRILTGTGVLIEEIQDYNLLTNLIYSFDTDPSLRDKRSITEGITLYNPANRSEVIDQEKSNYNNISSNPYFTSPSDGNSVQQWAKLQLPLHTGIFRNKTIFPAVMTSGLRLEIMLAEAKMCIRQPINLSSREHGPVVRGTAFTAATPPVINGEIPKATFTTTILDLSLVEHCPLQVGESFRINYGTGTGGFDVGAITKIEIENSLVKLTHAAVDNSGGTAVTLAGENARATSRAVSGTAGVYEPKFTLDEVELVLQQIMVPPSNVSAMSKAMKEQGVMRYEFLTYENYKRSQQSGERQATMALQLNNAEIKSVLSIGTNAAASSLSGKELVVDYTQQGLVGIIDNSTSYQWMYNGILNPDRRVDIEKLNDNKITQQYLIELEKALVVAGIPVKSFRKFLDNVVIGRAMALQQGSYDGRGKDFNLQISAEGTNAPTVGKLWNNFVAHVRAINISSDGVTIST